MSDETSDEIKRARALEAAIRQEMKHHYKYDPDQYHTQTIAQTPDGINPDKEFPFLCRVEEAPFIFGVGYDPQEAQENAYDALRAYLELAYNGECEIAPPRVG